MKALFIGRFQPFHNGHLLVLQHMSTEYAQIIIGIGSSQYHHTMDNPFSDEERRQMIVKSLEAAGIHSYRLVSIPDIHDPPRWVDHVCSLVSDFDVVIANNPLTRQLFSEKGYTVRGTPSFHRTHYSGKEIRRRMVHGESWHELVPEPVSRLIHSLDGVKRVKNLQP
ncbi:MAG: nicotinamide-nucleotide adenylyltransferase [Candidatus Thermoplasmatota archaeon]|nr:nicotinamide-nucleotide adenylyltransferase [Candidatus Thermoplasmatota archaeon]